MKNYSKTSCQRFGLTLLTTIILFHFSAVTSLAQKKKNKDNKSDRKSKHTKKNQSEKIEKQLNKLLEERKDIETQMEHPKAINQPKLMTELLEKYGSLQKEIEATEKSWVEEQEKEAS